MARPALIRCLCSLLSFAFSVLIMGRGHFGHLGAVFISFLLFIFSSFLSFLRFLGYSDIYPSLELGIEWMDIGFKIGTFGFLLVILLVQKMPKKDIHIILHYAT